MKGFFTERNLVVVLFIMVIIAFSFAQKDSQKIEKLYLGSNSSAASSLVNLAELKVKPASLSSFASQQNFISNKN